MAVRITRTVKVNTAQAMDAIRRGSVIGTNRAIEQLRADSVAKAPVDQGDLRGSATTLHTDEMGAPATLVFPEPYAAKQHEDESLHHTPGAHGEPAGQAHYVSSNYQDAGKRKVYGDLIGQAVRDELAR